MANDDETDPSTDTNEDATTAGRGRRLPGILAAAVAGIVSAIVAIGVAELVAAMSRDARSPLLDVGDRVVDLVPPAVKNLAIDLFGTADKAALLIGIGVLLVAFAAAVGIVTFAGHPVLGALGIALFGLAGTTSALAARSDRSLVAILPSIVGAIAGIGALLIQYRSASPEGGVTSPIDEAPQADDGEPARMAQLGAPAHSRRRALGIGATLAAAGVAAGVAGRFLADRFSAAASRAAVVLPRAAKPLAAAGETVRVDAAGVSPFYTPNSEFYRIDTALTVPQVDLESWRLTIDGMVSQPIELNYDDILAEPQVEADITLTCVSNEVGGNLLGTARWQGVRLDELLDRAGVDPTADQIVGRSVDGYTCGFPTETLDGRDALVAIAMNGEPLPLRHGFPARLVVPGLYGYVSATKWLRQIELTTFDEFDQYWVPRGWDERAPIKMSSRIDTPRGLETVEAGPVMVAGVAWAQPTGVAAVEVRVDEGPWEPAELADELNSSTWRQWKHRWEATEGRHTIAVRAVDANGAIQIAERSEPMPNGSTGHHEIVVLVNE